MCCSALWSSCTSNEKRLTNLEKSIEKLQDSLKNVNKHFVRPLEEFQAIVLSEFDNPPSISIEKYQKLINNYGNSYWAHESKKRIKNIKNRSKYWTQEGGWVLPKEIAEERVDQYVSYSCPGC